MAHPRWQRTSEALHSDLEGSTVVLHLQDGTYYSLEGVGTRIWKLLAQPHTQDELVDALAADYEVDRARLHADVARFLRELAGLTLVRQG